MDIELVRSVAAGPLSVSTGGLCAYLSSYNDAGARGRQGFDVQ